MTETDPEDSELIRLGVQANLARLYAEGQRDFVNDLASMLQTTLPDAITLERRGGLFAEKKISALKIQLGDYLYTLEVPARGPLAASRTKIVRGIKVKTETVAMEEWLSGLGAEVAAHAEDNLQTRETLQRMLGE
jgi:hypothetical protein